MQSHTRLRHTRLHSYEQDIKNVTVLPYGQNACWAYQCHKFNTRTQLIFLLLLFMTLTCIF